MTAPKVLPTALLKQKERVVKAAIVWAGLRKPERHDGTSAKLMREVQALFKMLNGDAADARFDPMLVPPKTTKRDKAKG